MASAATITRQGEQLRLHAERAIFWPRLRTLIVADLHWGKADTFRAAAIPVPEGDTAADLARLSGLLAVTGAERLLILGDLWHARAGRSERLIEALTAWRGQHEQLAIELVRGNHDRAAGDPPEQWRFTIHDEPRLEAPFAWRHFPEPTPDAYTLAGHVHPTVVLRGPGRDRLRLPCFHFGERVGILPAFGRFTGGGEVNGAASDQRFAIADGEVLPV